MRSILHVITTIDRGGAEKALLSLASAQKNSGIEVSVLPLKGRVELIEDFGKAGISVNLALIKSRNNPLLYLILLKRILSNYPLVHAHLPRAELVSALFCRRKQFIVTRHNSEKFLPHGFNLISRILSRFVTNRAFQVICISKAVETFVDSISEFGKNARSSVIHYGYSPAITCPEYLKSSNSYIEIGTVGRLVFQKNTAFLIQLTQKLIKQGFAIQTKILGQGPLLSDLQNLCVDLGVQNETTFLGVRKDIGKFMCELDYFVMTSHYEGFGLVLLEAMDAQIPILAPNHSSFPEVLGENHPGLYAPDDLEDAMKLFVSIQTNKLLRESIIRFQTRQLELFGMKNYLSAHQKIYESMEVQIH